MLDLLHAPDGAGGSTTAGGTESILMAMKAARDWAREHRPVSGAPEVVVPKTAHAAFDKGAEWLGMKVVRMGRSEGWRADVAGMADAIGENTVMIAGSAPPYPYGETDPIEELAQLAQEHDLWMHSDGCIGGMILPFMKALGDAIPPFDFAVPGVTSMSVDMHKFGYAHKGISLCLLRDRALERYHRTTFDGWPAGTYSTPTITGTRSGGGVASAWAVMTHLGEEGYLRIHEVQRRIRERLIEGIGAIEGLAVLGHPHALHVTFYARGLRHLRGRGGDGGARLALDPHARAGFDPPLDQHEACGKHRRLSRRPGRSRSGRAERRPHGGQARCLQLCDLTRAGGGASREPHHRQRFRRRQHPLPRGSGARQDQAGDRARRGRRVLPVVLLQRARRRGQGLRAQDRECRRRDLPRRLAGLPRLLPRRTARTWPRVATDYDGKVLTIRHRPVGDEVRFAYFAPYPMARHDELIARMADARPLVTARRLGETLDGAPLDLLEVGGARARTCWIIGRQHPGETMAEWWMEGFLERLLDPADPLARALLEKARFYVVPNMNPDGSRRGHLRTNAAGV